MVSSVFLSKDLEKDGLFSRNKVLVALQKKKRQMFLRGHGTFKPSKKPSWFYIWNCKQNHIL